MAVSTAQPTTPSQAKTERWYNSKEFRRLRRNPLAILGTALIAFFLFLSIFAPLLTARQIAERSRGHTCARDLGLERGEEGVAQLRNPLTPYFWRAIVWPPQSCLRIPRASFSAIPEAPSEQNILGTSPGGYDIYYGVIWGARMAFNVGVFVSVISVVIGMIVGGLAGYFGGWLDNALMRLTDTIFAFPNLVLAVVFVTIFGRGLLNALLALALVGWVTYARIFRGDILRIKQFEFVDGARALGAKNWRVFFRHVLPNSIGSLVIVASLDIGTVVVTASTLAFLGLGAEIGTADWGQMVNFASGYLQGSPGQPFRYWYISFWPGLAIVLFSLSWNLLGDAYRDIFDPRNR
jgi:peptide/nickel transport system permease protein